jgi:hypothetical protein
MVAQHLKPRPTVSTNFPPNLLTVMEAAKFIRLSKSFLDKARVKGGGPEFVKAGARVFYEEVDLTAWLRSRKFPHTSAYA